LLSQLPHSTLSPPLFCYDALIIAASYITPLARALSPRFSAGCCRQFSFSPLLPRLQLISFRHAIFALRFRRHAIFASFQLSPPPFRRRQTPADAAAAFSQLILPPLSQLPAISFAIFHYADY